MLTAGFLGAHLALDLADHGDPAYRKTAARVARLHRADADALELWCRAWWAAQEDADRLGETVYLYETGAGADLKFSEPVEPSRAVKGSRRTAVDQATKDYYRELWGDYGELLTEDVPRKVARALARRINSARTAEAGSEAPPLAVGSVVPWAASRQPSGSIIFEGVFRGRPTNGEFVFRAFRAELSSQGELIKLEDMAG
jgi:hypothetical protein